MDLDGFLPLAGATVSDEHTGCAVLEVQHSGGEGLVIRIRVLGDGVDIPDLAAEETHQVNDMDRIFQCGMVLGGRTVLLTDDNIGQNIGVNLLCSLYYRSVTAVKADHQLLACLFGQLHHPGSVLQRGSHGLFAVNIHTRVQQELDLLGVAGLGGQDEGTVQTQIHELFQGGNSILCAAHSLSPLGLFQMVCHDAHDFHIIHPGQHRHEVVLGYIADTDDANTNLILSH